MNNFYTTADHIRESITDCNTWHRRFYRCFIDGSYTGATAYKWNCALVCSNYHDDRALRAIAIRTFCEFLSIEESCKPSTAQRHLVNTVPRDVLEALNVELIDDLRDLVRDEMGDAA